MTRSLSAGGGGLTDPPETAGSTAPQLGPVFPGGGLPPITGGGVSAERLQQILRGVDLSNGSIKAKLKEAIKK